MSELKAGFLIETKRGKDLKYGARYTMGCGTG